MTSPLQKSALVVLSGGQDSTTCLFWAKRDFETVHAITFHYGQRHNIEINAAIKVGLMAEVASHEIVYLGSKILRGSSPLTNHSKPLEVYPDYSTMDKTIGDRIELTFVPMRNALFLTIAANRAAILGCNAIITGVCQQDNANYPDCRAEFIVAQEQAIMAALGHKSNNHLRILTPLMFMTKAESIRWAKGFDGCMAAMAYTHTAYDGCYPPTGKDHASTLRAQGFLEAGVADPLVVRAWREGLMKLPNTSNYAGIDENEYTEDELKGIE